MVWSPSLASAAEGREEGVAVVTALGHTRAASPSGMGAASPPTSQPADLGSPEERKPVHCSEWFFSPQAELAGPPATRASDNYKSSPKRQGGLQALLA